MKINKETHYVGILNLTMTTATIKVESEPQIAILFVGEEKKFEVTNDYYYDILITLNSIENEKVEIVVKGINESFFETAEISKEIKAKEGPKKFDRKALIPLVMGLIIIGIEFWAWIQRRKSR
jgi:hypothetical protein